jgi:hypothetical protein
MSAVELHNVDDAVDQIARGLATTHRPGLTWGVLGEPTAGKSAVLEHLHQRLLSDGAVRSILVSPPARAYDAGHAALIDLAEGLELDERALGVVRDPQASWETKLRRVRAALGREGRRTVLLVDEPAGWSPRDTYFRTFVGDVWDLVFDRFDIATVTAGSPPFRVRSFRPIHLDPASDPEGVFAAIDSAILGAAKAAVQSRFREHLADISPLQIRLLVAIAALREQQLDVIDPTLIEHRTELVGTLVGLVDTGNPELREVWVRLAAVREPFEDDLLGLVGGRRLSPLESAIATQCLLFPRRDRLFLHESLRGIRTLVEHDQTGAHRLLAAYYRHRFDDPEAGAPVRLRDAVEAFHHASSAGIVELDTYRPFFVDQLNILGYHLSVDQDDLERAADVFSVALQWDPRNAYAAHYRAFNLDRLAGRGGPVVDPNEVERLYRQALEERPEHPWFRSRLINFLLAEARIDEAWTEWLLANEAIGSDPPEYVYFGLHLHVARNLLYRGELEHAESVLRTLPPELATDERFAVIKERVAALREARDNGSYVPAPYLKPGWWRRPKLVSERGLTRWLAARVSSVSADAVDLDVADITPGTRPVYGGLELPVETLATWWRGPGDLSTLEAGEFLEVGFYGDGDDAQGLALRHPRVRWPDLARPNEDPDRYLRAAA